MKSEEKVRKANGDERSIRLVLEGYTPETCAGKCDVHSRALIGDPNIFVITGITHKCERMKSAAAGGSGEG